MCRYDVNESINDMDKQVLMMVLRFHPHGDRKIGLGIKEVKVHYLLQDLLYSKISYL